MNFQRQVSRALHDDHRASIELLGRVGQSLARLPRGGAGSDPQLARLMGSCAGHLERDLGRHFDFDETELFPRLADAGEDDIAELLREEHLAIRELSGEVLPRASEAAAGRLDDAGWAALRRGALEMVERQFAHIRKETMALLPMLDDLLDDDTDRELAFAHAAG